MSEFAPTHRRWFQFGIGTLLILVTVFAVWLGWELNVVRSRQAWLRAHPDALHKGEFKQTGNATIPRLRGLLGDAPIPVLVSSEDWTKDDLEKAGKLFPEAELIRVETDSAGWSQLTSPSPGK